MTKEMRDFEVLTKARRAHYKLKRIDDGWIVKYDGDLYFVYEPDEKFNDIEECTFWTFDIERHWIFEEVDEETYHYYESQGFLRKLNLDAYK